MKILIADSDKENRNNIKEILRLNLKDGIRNQFIVVSRGKMVLAELILEKPDIAIIDMKLPDLNITEILSTLKYLSKTELLKIPKVVMSLRTEKSILMELFKYGVKDFLIKPIDTEALIKKVESVLKR